MIPASAADWEEKKEIIRELYMEQNIILNEVINIMVTKYRFRATPGNLISLQQDSVLQQVRAAQDHFLQGRPQRGGEMLRRAFLSIERAVSSGLDIEALWDCCLGVPQLALTMGWTDMLSIFARYLHQYTSIKLPNHPITRVAESLHKLSRGGAQNWQLQLFVTHGWHLWIDSLNRVRGRQNDVTIHFKRGYVTLVDPHHRMAQDIISDFGQTVHNSLARRGAFATTSRILELEHLLVRMFVPLFTAETARRAEVILEAVVSKIEAKERNLGVPVTEWEYMDRYLVFSAFYFLSSLAEYNGEANKAERQT
ncbi:hypothetical protein N0V88_003374 [Collariella sp. IMI 366227]|nr:hypothetical protein N0V88_003374 [Collariella sp. IMI 366227]